MEFKQEIFDRFSVILKKTKNLKIKKSDLLKEQEDLSQELEMQREIIQHLKTALAQAHDELESNNYKCYERGVQQGKYLASLEEQGVLEEFKMLQEICTTLEIDRKQGVNMQ